MTLTLLMLLATSQQIIPDNDEYLHFGQEMRSAHQALALPSYVRFCIAQFYTGMIRHQPITKLLRSKSVVSTESDLCVYLDANNQL